MATEKNKEKKKLNKGAKALIIILLLLLALAASGVIAVNHYLDKINKVGDVVAIPPEQEDFETDAYDPNLEVIDPDSVVWDNYGYQGNDEGLINILLVGQDRRPGEGRQRSDTMILCSYNPRTNNVAMISFLRDLYVQIPGYSDNRLNAAYVFGGFPLLKKTLYKNFGVNIDGCFEVDFGGFKKIIDIVGGVDIELTAAEAKIVGDGAKAGVCHLDGDHALIYARIRKIDSDFQRTARQRRVLNAIFEKIRHCSISEILSLVNEILPLLTTDWSNSQILSFAIKHAPAAASLRIYNYSVPSKGDYTSAMIRGMAVKVPDLTLIKKRIFEEYLPM